jgi:hypothetical protein
MIVKLTIGSWRFTFSMAPITNIIGVDSTLEDGKHIIMMDFDATKLEDVINEMLKIQAIYNLPTIYIAETSKGTGFHAWCFKKVSWRKLIEILAMVKGLDWNYFKYGIYRGHFTLRVSTKCGRQIKHVTKLPSPTPEDVTTHDLRNWVKYETLADGRKSRKYELKITRSK